MLSQITGIPKYCFFCLLPVVKIQALYGFNGTHQMVFTYYWILRYSLLIQVQPMCCRIMMMSNFIFTSTIDGAVGLWIDFWCLRMYGVGHMWLQYIWYTSRPTCFTSCYNWPFLISHQSLTLFHRCHCPILAAWGSNVFY